MTAPFENRLWRIVDDSRTVRRIARRIVEAADMQAAEATSGEEGLAACRRLRPEYVLLDWNMPRMNGIECLRTVRRGCGGTRPGAILCTTENDPEHIVAAIEAGAQEFIMKPFDADILLGRIADVAPGLGSPA